MSLPICRPPRGHTLVGMQTSVHEVASGVYRLSTCVPDITPDGFTFNQYLIDADEPMLFHTGPHRMFPLVSDAVARILDPSRLRWVSFGHVEADECGAVNDWLRAAPSSVVAFNAMGCQISVDDLADRPPHHMIDDGTYQLGGHHMRALLTPHVPHGWDAQVLFDQTTATLFCGDLFTRTGDGPALVHDADLIAPAMAAEDLFGFSSLHPSTPAQLRRLADLEPRTLALMHGPAFAGDCAGALRDLADAYEQRLAAAAPIGGAA